MWAAMSPATSASAAAHRLVDGVLHGPGAAGAVGLQYRLCQPQEGGGPHGVRVQPVLEGPQAVLHQQGRHLGAQALEEHSLQLPAHEGTHALDGLEHHIAGKAVGHDHVAPALHGLLGLDVADEVEVPRLPGGLQNLVCIPAELVALAVLAADVEKSPPGDSRSPGPGRRGSCPGRANWTRYSTEHSALAPQSMSTALPPAVGMAGAMAARRMPRTRLTSRVPAERRAPVLPAETKASPSPAFSRFKPTVMEGVLFHLKGGGGVVVHVDDLRGVDHGHPRRQAAALLRRGADLSLPAHQNKLQAGAGPWRR